MKVKTGITMILMTVVVLLSIQPAIAGRGCTGSNVDTENYISVDKTAPGTKYNATLTIYYEDANCYVPGSVFVDMTMLLRVEGNVSNSANYYSGSELLPFFGTAECLQYWSDGPLSTAEAIAVQQDAVEDFFRYDVNPFIYSKNHPEDPDGCDPDSADTATMCPPFALKSIDKVVDGFDEGKFTVMDLVIAIQD